MHTTMGEHLDDAVLMRFFRGQLDRRGSREVVQHLATECPACRETAGQLWRTLGQPASEDTDNLTLSQHSAAPYDAAIERAFAIARQRADALEEHRRKAPALAAMLAGHPLRRQLTMVRNSQRFASFALSELLQDRSYDLRFDARQEAVELAEVALAVAERVPDDQLRSPQRADLLARAGAHLGNALRLVSNYDGAATALQTATSTLKQGSGDPLLRALVLRFRGQLEKDRGHFDRCHRLLQRAATLYARLGESRLLALCVLSQGTTYLEEQEPEEALEQFQRALAIYERLGEDPRLILATRHNIAFCLNEMGRHEEARRLLHELRPHYLQLGDRINILRSRWLEGSIAQGLNQPQLAEVALIEARDGFARQGVAHDVALVSLDLVGLWAGQRRWSEMREAAEQALVLCRSLGVAREAIAALVAVRQAIEAEKLSIELLRRVSATLQQAKRRPAPQRPNS